MIKRSTNKVDILRTLYKHPNISRSEISQRLSLNKSSISEYINKLININIIRENGTGDSTNKGGRKPIYLEINYQYGLCLGIDLAPDEISYALCDLQLNIIDYGKTKTNINKTNIIENISNIINVSIEKSKSYSNGLIGATFAIHGIVDQTDIRFTPNYDIYKCNVYKAISNLYPSLQIHLINESNASALFESYSTHIHNLVAINVGSGLGAGIIVEGNLLHGVNGYAGEIGHVVIIPDGENCNCGNRGCFERYCSNGAVISYYNSLTPEHIYLIDELIKEYKNGNPKAYLAIQYNLKYMALLMNHIMKTIAPEIIVINSDLAYHLDTYTTLLQDMTSKTYKQNIKIQASTFHHKSVILGAVYQTIKEFIYSFE
ncbi:MAG: ROK family protein [Treponema sp.]